MKIGDLVCWVNENKIVGVVLDTDCGDKLCKVWFFVGSLSKKAEWTLGNDLEVVLCK